MRSEWYGEPARPGVTAMGSEVLLRRAGPVAQVTLNRPDRLNALSASLMDELRALWRELSTDPGLRCVVLTGAGRGFCAGADMSLLATDRSAEDRTVDEELSFLPGAVLDVPVIVAVNGVCSGGGLHFVADADIAIASTRASFLDPHVNAGQVSALEPVTLLPRVRADVVRRMALLGSAERLDAVAAERAGLVSEVVEPDALAERAAALAAAVVRGSPTAVAASRAVLRAAEERLVRSSLEQGWDRLRAHWGHPDALEGPRAWSEKRDPVWAPRSVLRRRTEEA